MFPGAGADRSTAAYVVLGAPLDVTTTFRPGTRFGPARIREFAATFDDYDHRTDSRFIDLGVHDQGDIHAWTDVEEYLSYLTGVVTDIVDDDAVPLLLGGEHTISVAGVRAVEPDVFVCLDAHLDLRTEYDGDRWSHATTTRHALEVATTAVVIGARTGAEDEWERAAQDDVIVVTPEDVEEWITAVAAGDGPFDPADRLYLSVDIDVLDPAFAPGTGTMEPFGVDPTCCRTIVETLAPMTVGFDVVEVNDADDGQAATLAGKLLRTFIYHHAASESKRLAGRAAEPDHSSPDESLSSPEPAAVEPAADRSDGTTADELRIDVDRETVRRVVRLLQNRAFPVERSSFVSIATSAYELDGIEVDAVLDLAIDRGMIEQRGPMLHRLSTDDDTDTSD